MQDVTYAHATVQAKNKGCLLQKKKVGGEKKRTGERKRGQVIVRKRKESRKMGQRSGWKVKKRAKKKNHKEDGGRTGMKRWRCGGG